MKQLYTRLMIWIDQQLDSVGEGFQFIRPLAPRTAKLLLNSISLFLIILVCLPKLAYAQCDYQTPVEIHYLPIAEDQMHDFFTTIFPGYENCQGAGFGAGNPNPGCFDINTGISVFNVDYPLNRYFSIAIPANGTILYFDHWEDGYEFDLENPTQPSTEIWGDGNLTNGVAPGFPTDILAAGDVIAIESILTGPPNPGTIFYDGRDKIASSYTVAITHFYYPSQASNGNPWTLIAGAAPVLSSDELGTNFTMPIGENADLNQMFEHVGAFLQAQEDGANIDVDFDADGVVDMTYNLGEGETVFINGGLMLGATIVSDNPISVQIQGSDICSNYGTRSFLLYDDASLSSSYVASVSTPDMAGIIGAGGGSAAGHNASTRVFLYNPNTTPITVNWMSSSGAQPPIIIPAGSQSNVVIPFGDAAMFTSLGGENFNAISTIDSDERGVTDCIDYLTTGGIALDAHTVWDWGYTLIPLDELGSQFPILALAPGSDPRNSPITDNTSPLWLTAFFPPGSTSTGMISICIDFDGDGGSLSDPLGGLTYDTQLMLNSLTSERVFDLGDSDNSGTRIWVCDGSDALLMGAWGEDPLTAAPGSPSLDLGTAIVPGLGFSPSKQEFFIVDEDRDNAVDIGIDTILFCVCVNNTGAIPIDANEITVYDSLVAQFDYVEGSTYGLFGGVETPIPDAGTSTFPLDEAGILFPYALNPTEIGSICYEVTASMMPPVGTAVCNNAIVGNEQGAITPKVIIQLDEDCMLDAVLGPLSCDPNGTFGIGEDTDDTNTFSVDVTAMLNMSPMYDIAVEPAGPTLTPNTGTIGTPQDIVISNFTSGTPYSIIISNTGDILCADTIMITPMSCSDCPVVNPPNSNGDVEFCMGDPIPSLSVTVGAGFTVDWYDAAVGGTLLLANSLSYTPPGVGVYFAEAHDIMTPDCISDNRTAVTLTMNPLPRLDAGPDISICDGQEVVINPVGSGGTSPYTIILISVTPINAVSFTYTYELTDDNGCTAIDAVIVTTLNNPNISVNPDFSLCNGELISLMASHSPSGSSTSIDTWSWTGPAGFASSMQNPMPFAATAAVDGVYTVTATDNNGCMSVASVDITVDPTPRIQAFANNVCEGELISLEATFLLTSSSTSVSTWAWTGPDSFSSSMEDPTPFTATAAATGTYTVMVTDNNGCTTTENIDVEVFPLPAISAPPIVVCSGEDVVFDATFTPNGASTTIVTWTWTGPNSFNASIEDPTILAATPMNSGNYTLAVTDNNGCVNQITVNVQVDDLPIVSADGQDVCEDENIQLMATYTANGSSGTASSWVWAGPNNFSSGSEDPVIAAATLAATGTYMVTVTDNNGCTAMASVDIVVNPRPPASPSLGDLEYCENEDAPIIGVQNPGTGFTIEWFVDASSNTLISGVTVIGFNNESIILNMGSTPPLPTAGNSVTIYAQTRNDMTACISRNRTPVTLTNNPEPVAVPTSMTLCEEVFQSREATFDLSLLIDDINADFIESSAAAGGIFTSSSSMLNLSFHVDMGDAGTGANPIPNPTSFVNMTLSGQTIFARVVDVNTACYTVVQVVLSIAGLPDVDNLNLSICPDLNADTRSGVDITAAEGIIASGNGAGTYTIQWFSDAALSTSVPNPNNVTVADGDVFYALITFTGNPMCQNVGLLTYAVDPSPPIVDVFLEFCEDEALMGEVAAINLRDNDLTVSSGISAIVNWFEDDNFSIVIPDPTNVTINIAGNGTEDNIFYAQVSDGNCQNRARLILTVFEQPVPLPAGPFSLCANDIITLTGSGLTGSATMGMWMVSGMPAGGDGLVLPSGLLADPSTATFTATVPGDYTLTLTTNDPTGPCPSNSATTLVTVHPLPVAMPSVAQVCVGESVEVDGNPIEGTAPYMTHQWIDLGTGDASGYTLVNATAQILTIDASSVTNATAGIVNLEYTVTDANGCVDSGTTTVRIHPLPVLNPQAAMVCVGATVTVDGAPSAGTMPFMHEWTDLETGTASNYNLIDTDEQVLTIDASNTLSSESGTVILTYSVTDINGCSQSANVTVTINPLPNISIADANIACATPQQVDLNAITTASNPIYVWTGPGILAGGNTATPTVNLPGTYTVMITDGTTGCVNTENVFVTQDPLSKCLPAAFEIKTKGGE